MTSRITGGLLRRAVFLAWLVALMLPEVVAAHAELVRANPEDDEVVTAPVTAVTGRYSEDLRDGSRLVVKDASGATVGTGQIDPGDDRRMIARFDPALTEGSFIVESTSVSAQDGDVDRATWTFTVAVPPSPEPTPTPDAFATAVPSPTDAPSPTAATSTSPSPTASPASGDATSSGGDVLLPIIAALAIVAIGAGFLLNRSRRARP
jgi:methionine-rich copper-binding protein CopC